MGKVVLRCKKDRALLAEVGADPLPTDWSATVFVPRCKKCDMPSSRRIVDYMTHHDLDGVPMGGELPLWAIRDELLAASKGKKVNLAVSFSTQEDGLHLHLA